MTSVLNAETTGIRKLTAPKTRKQQTYKIDVKDKYSDLNSDLFDMGVLFEHVKYFDEIDMSSNHKVVKSRLSRNIDFWKHISASKFILDILQYGYLIRFCDIPPPMCFTNNRSALQKKQFRN